MGLARGQHARRCQGPGAPFVLQCLRQGHFPRCRLKGDVRRGVAPFVLYDFDYCPAGADLAVDPCELALSGRSGKKDVAAELACIRRAYKCAEIGDAVYVNPGNDLGVEIGEAVIAGLEQGGVLGILSTGKSARNASTDARPGLVVSADPRTIWCLWRRAGMPVSA